MNGVIGMSGLLLGTPLTEEQYDYASGVRSSAEALLSIINDILDFSKIEAGKMVIEVTDFNLRNTMEEIADLLATTAQQKDLELTCHVPPGFPEHLRGDPGRLRQILTNLIGNAIKFTDQGEVALAVSVVEKHAEKVVVRFTVRDTGIGIPLDRQAAVFDSFTQADSTTTRKYGGTGLGLTICRQLATLMGGTIGLKSEPGNGSEFWLQLALERSAAPIAEGGAGYLADLHVLAVDDNATNRIILREQLRSWGCRPILVASGEEALFELEHAAADDPFRLVILDMHMPDMDGEETAARINADPRFAGLPMVLLSSIGAFGSQEEMRGKGFVAAITKPVRSLQLLNTLLAVLGMSSEQRTQRDPDRTMSLKTARPLRILLAEDNAVNQKLAVRMLERWGHRIDPVANGKEALDALTLIPYDLVLMDVQMPEMDGLEATALIRRRERGGPARIPIIAMTANALAGDRERCIASGMDGYVAKPVRPAELFEAIERFAHLERTATNAA
jgi:CheY-like chemotaxis protein